MWHIWGRREMNREFWWGNLKQTDHRPIARSRPRHEDNIKMDIREMVGK